MNANKIETTIRKIDINGAIEYALNRLTHDLSPTLKYHSTWHTEVEVVNQVLFLAAEEKLSNLHQDLVHTAAVYHDIGFIVTRDEHEQISAQIAASVLPHFGYAPDHINLIKGMILSTKLPQKPKNFLDQVLSDADLDLLGRSDYMTRNSMLRNELALEGHIYSDENWYCKQLLFLQNHSYFTVAAKRLRTVQKQENINKVDQICRMIQGYKSVTQVHKLHSHIPQYTPL